MRGAAAPLSWARASRRDPLEAAARVAALLTALATLLGAASCTFRPETPVGGTVGCAEPGDCGPGLLCVREWGLCVPALQACIVEEGAGAALASDGTACPTGICIRGQCLAPRCGDGLRTDPEVCDDANDAETDACRSDCTAARCGDGVVWQGHEECDDGNAIEEDACRNSCVKNRCGDGVVHVGEEECDDNNDIETDGCLTTCLENSCGDGFVHLGVEDCDDGNSIEQDACRNDCTPAACGDGILYAAEEKCDDGNRNEEDACKNNCELNVCGDGVVHADVEECDDGNISNADGCLVPCITNRCGDGFLHQGVELCDDGNADNSDACRSDCKPNICGDGVLRAELEVCDDGNTTSGDGCSDDCGKVELCGDSVLDEGEACDDGNGNELDRCSECSRFTWTPVVRVGLGAGGGDPRATPLVGTALTVDAEGNVLLANLQDLRLYRLDATAEKLTGYAGTGTPTDIGESNRVPATDVNMAGVLGLSVDGLGNVLVADIDEAVIRRIDVRTRVVETIAGTGEQGFGGDGLPATLASLQQPEMALADGSGNIFIADTDNHRIRRVDARTGIITTVAGNGLYGFAGDGGDPLLASLSRPRALEFDGDGNLYILDRHNGRIRRLEPDPNDRSRFIRITTAVGNNTEFDPDGEGLLRGIGGALLQSMSLSPDGTRLYIVSSSYPAVLVADLENETLEVFAGHASEEGARVDVPALDARFTELEDVRVDGPHRVYVTEPGAGLLHVVERTDASAPWHVRTVAGAPPAVTDERVFGFSPYLMQQVGAGYALSTRAGCEAFDDVPYVHGILPDAHRLIERACSGAVRSIAGTGVPGFSGDGGPARLAQLHRPRGVAATSTGLVYIADTENHRVRTIDADGVMQTLAGNGAADFGGDGAEARAASLDTPTDVALDDQQRLIIVDSANNRLRRVDLATGVIDTIAGTGADTSGADGLGPTTIALAQPYGVRFLAAAALVPNSSGGLVVFTERRSHKVRVLVDIGLPDVPPALTPPRIFTLAGTGAPGFTDADNGKQARFFYPRALSLYGGPGCTGAPGEAALCLLVLDGHDRIRVLHITPTSNLAEPIAARVSTLLGGPSPLDDGTFDTALLRGPSSFTFLDDTRVLLVERVTGRLRLVDLETLEVQTLSGLPDGEDPDEGEVPQDVARPLAEPTSVVYDPTQQPGRLYVAEKGRHMVREFILEDPAAPETWTTRTFAGTPGTAGHRDGPLTEARFGGPSGLALDAEAGVLFVAEHDNHTIRRIDLVTETVTTLAGRPGQLGAYGDGVAAATALLYNPSGLALAKPDPQRTDAPATLYVADTGNNRVRRIHDLDGPTPIIASVLGDGAAASSGEGGPARFFPVHAPTGVDIDADGNVYATSLNAVRMVLADDAGAATGDHEVTSIYGLPPRVAFPEPITTCVRQARITPAASSIFVIDECQGLLIELARTKVP